MGFLQMFELFTWLQKSDLLDRGIPHRTQIEMYEEYGDYLTMGSNEAEGQALAAEVLETWKADYPRRSAA